MKIGVVTPYFYPAWEYGGTPRAAFELAKALAARGHEIRVLTTGSKSETTTVDGVHIRYYKNLSNALAFKHRLFLPIGFRRELGKQLEGCNILHIHECRSTMIVPAARVARQMSLPYIVSPHGGLRHLGRRGAKRVFDALWGNFILHHAACVLALSEREKADALSFGVPAPRIAMLANVIDGSRYQSLPNRTTSRKTILFLGRLNRIKGVDILLEAFEGLENVQLILAGPDDGAGAGIPASANIIKTGFLDHEPKLQALVDSDVVVVPSRSEATGPIVLYEALLCGRPAIVSSACDLPMANPAKHGILQFENLNAVDLRAKLLAALDDNDLKDNVAFGREFVLREFSPSAIAEKAERIFEESRQRFHDRAEDRIGLP